MVEYLMQSYVTELKKKTFLAIVQLFLLQIFTPAIKVRSARKSVSRSQGDCVLDGDSGFCCEQETRSNLVMLGL